MLKTFNKQILSLRLNQNNYSQHDILDLKHSSQDDRLDLKSSCSKNSHLKGSYFKVMLV